MYSTLLVLQQLGPHLRAGLFLAFLSCSGLMGQTIRYVSPTGTNANPATATNWATSTTNLQGAINSLSASGGQVWVAAGTYKPGGNANTTRSSSFTIVSGVAVYGGFAGTETALVQRLPGNAAGSILSGDIGTAGNNADNSYHVVRFYRANNQTRLDRFVITGGNANGGSYPDNSGGGVFNDGGFGSSSYVVLTNCTFQANNATSGGAIYNDATTYGVVNLVLTNCAFLGNTASLYGGAMYNNPVTYGGIYPVLTNCSFQGNTASGGLGGAMYNNNSTSEGGTVSSVLTNCVLFGNGAGNTFVNAPGGFMSTSASNSLFDASVTGYSGSNNLTTTTTPFASFASVALSPCSSGINAGLNSASGLTGITTDLAGNPRLVEQVDMGAIEDQSVRFVTAGTIGGPPIVPFPQETPITLTSPAAPTGVPATITFAWQQSLNNSTWTNLPNTNAQTIGLPAISNDGAAVKSYYFRRIASVCNTTLTATTPSLEVRVVPADGVITGRVVSGDGFTPVASVTITAVRTTTGLAGSPGSMTYTTVTNADGTYNISPVYYGVNSSITPTGSVTASSFVVTPRYTDPNNGSPGSPTLAHVFSPASQTISLNQFTNPRNLSNFTDLTTFAITGQTRQTCPDCITGLSGSTPQTGFVSCPIDSVVIKTFQGATQLGITKTGYLDLPPPGDYGRFAATINNPGTYTLTATVKNLVFTPASQTVSVSSNVYDLRFDSPTSQTIQGRVSAGCGEAIGSAVLEFTDVLTDATGNQRPSCFKKRVTTSPTGYYQVILPPRTYNVTALSLSPNGTAGVAATDFIAFINTQLPADSLTRNLTSTTAIVTLNLVYERPPTLAVEGLVSPVACGTASAFSVMEQSVKSPLTVRIYQGPVSRGCPVSGGLFATTTTAGGSGSVVSSTGISGTLIVATTVQKNNGETIQPAFASGVANLTLTPGEPNVAAPYTRSFTVQFTDKFGRAAALLNRNVVVTGAKSGTQTFETVTPALPLFVLHDPPGDGSFSFREQAVVSTQSYKVGGNVSFNRETSVKVKVGIKAQVGIGFSTETAFQLLANTALDIGGTLGANNEWTFTTTTTNLIATSDLPTSVGDDADVVVGAAYNMLYSLATDISLTNSCSVVSKQILAIAPDRVATDYYYTVRTIRDQVIPNLKNLFALTPATDSVLRNDYTGQISLWQQILTNNEANKARAKYGSNKTFNGGGTQFTSTLASLEAETYAVEYSMFLSSEVSTGLGLKGGGNEGDALTRMKLRFEVNGNTRGTRSTQVTTGYTLVDTDIGDRFTVDIGQDPAYATPVFKLLAGESSCPPEAKTRPRDNFEFSAPVTVVSGVPAGGNAVFTLNMSNVSEVITDPNRSVTLELVAGSNPDNATVRINGSDYNGPVSYSLARLSQLQITILIRQGNPNIYAYEGLKFRLSASCGGSSKIITLSAYFQNPCSNVTLVTPEPNWVTTIADNNSLPVLISGYTVANLTDVSLEYTPQGASGWQTGFTRTAAQLNNSTNGTLTTWNTTGLPDGAYDLRLKLTCTTGNGGVGTAYSTRASGLVDRTPPDLFGIPQPASGNYVVGNTIGINYDEPLACSRIKTSNASVLTRSSNGQVIPATVGCSNNQIVIVPTGSLAPYVGEVLSVTLTGIADVYGNVRTTPDIWNFTVGSSTAATGASALSVMAGSVGGVSLVMNEDAAGTMNVVFRLPAQAPNNIFINFSVAGTASYGVDYTTTYNTSGGTQPLSATVNGAIGTVIIPTGASSVTLLVDPVADTRYETDETVIISLLDGGNYGISAAASLTATILNDDQPGNQNVITSIKTGNWEDPETWDLVRIPLATDEVILDQTHTITLSTPGSAKKVTPRQNARLRLPVSTAKLRLGF